MVDRRVADIGIDYGDGDDFDVVIGVDVAGGRRCLGEKKRVRRGSGLRVLWQECLGHVLIEVILHERAFASGWCDDRRNLPTSQNALKVTEGRKTSERLAAFVQCRAEISNASLFWVNRF